MNIFWWSVTLSLLKTTNNALTFWFWLDKLLRFWNKSKKQKLFRPNLEFGWLPIAYSFKNTYFIHSFVCLFCIWLSLIIRMNVLFSPQKAFIVIPFINSSKYGSTLINFLQVQFYFTLVTEVLDVKNILLSLCYL